MQWTASAFSVALMVVCAGCESEGPVAVSKPVVVEPDNSSFGFEGNWKLLGEPPFGEGPVGELLVVKRLDDGSYEAAFNSAYKAICRAASLNDEKKHALLEVTLQGDGHTSKTYLAVAAIHEGQLYFSLIVKPKQLAQCMAMDGFSAVIEHGIWTSTLTADGADVLICVRNHTKELLTVAQGKFHASISPSWLLSAFRIGQAKLLAHWSIIGSPSRFVRAADD